MAITSLLGTGQLGAFWLGADDTAAPAPPPLDPSTVPWNLCDNPGDPPAWRRRTLDSFAVGPVLPQPTLNPLTIPFYQASDTHLRVTPRWRYTTQESYAQPFFPSLVPSQQINLASQGINHRGIGTPHLTGGTQGLQAFVSGTNESAYFLALTANITRQLGTSGSATVKFLVASGGWVPVLGSSITIVENNKTVFNGIIDRRKYTVYPATSLVEYTAYCVDWNGLLQRHLIAKDYVAGTLLGIVQDMLMQPSINPDHIDPSGVDTSLTVDDFSFSYIKLSDALNQLADATNTIWWIDNAKVLHMIRAANATSSSYSVAENGMQTDPEVTVEDSLANYRNTQYLRTSGQILSESVTVTDNHTFSGAVADIVDITRYPLTSAPASVLENGIEIVGTARFFQLMTDGSPTTYPPGGEGYYWAIGFYGIWHWPSYSPPINGATLAVVYTGMSTYAGNVVKYQDSTEILRLQGISGGSGVYEEIEDYSGSITYAQALQLAQGIEQATAPPPQTLTVTTIEPIEDVGYAVSVVLPRWALNGTYIIQQISRIHCGAVQASGATDLGFGTAFRTTIQLVAARTLGNWTQYFERLLARLNKSFVVAPTEKPTWGLAFDTPGALSNGLSVGAFGEPWSVQTGLGRIAYVSAVFATAADANIVIDIFLNGNSIFDSSKLVYTPGDTGTQILYANLNPTKVNLTRGDLLTLSVIGCGSVSPGKNGNVTVVISQR